jgi:hypothetical protein
VTIAFMLAVLTSLGVLTLRSTRRTAALEVAARTHALVERELNLLVATPFGSLPARAGCETSRGQFPHTRCVTVADMSPQVRRITLVVAAAHAQARPDTVVLDRAAPASRPLRRP